MRRLLVIGWALLLAAGCLRMNEAPYGTEGSTHRLTVTAAFPPEYASFEGIPLGVRVENVLSGSVYTGQTDGTGTAGFTLVNGIYRVSVNGQAEGHIFNGNAEGTVDVLGADQKCSVPLHHSKSGALVIKELYTGGCSKAPQEGTWQSDKYVIIHNNSAAVTYLDGLCMGTVAPYNANANNPFPSDIDFAPIIQAVLQFPGSGTDHPLAPGTDAVVSLCGAVDHTLQYPLSVNLNREDYFALYNPTFFPNTTYHPAPGDKIRPDHLIDIVIKTGQANAYTVSVSSPTFLLFRAEGMTMTEYVALPESITQIPGSTERVVKIPHGWVIDAVEVFDGRSTGNRKRLPAQLDAGYVTQSDTYCGHSLFRRTDEEATAVQGFEVLQDTNNSTDDLYERETQSLHP